MSMFENYENNSYTAYNITAPKVSTLTQRYLYSPIVAYDKFHNIKGFVWDPNDKFTLDLNLSIRLNVLEDSIVYESSGQKPDINTKGTKGQRCYNTVDGKSWVCKGTLSDAINGGWIPLLSATAINPEWESIISALKSNQNDEQSSTASSTFIWEEDSLITFVKDGTKEIILKPYIENKSMVINILDFRHEIIYSYTFDDANECKIHIDKDTTPLLVEGQFFIDIIIKTEDKVQQFNQYPIMIKENPCKYVQANDKSIYIENSTIQPGGNTDYVWEPLINSNDDDYVWIPIQNSSMRLFIKR